MAEEQKRILQMLQDGVISAEDADKLLAAVDDGAPEIPALDPEPAPEPVSGEVLPPPAPPRFDHFRHYWRYPFAAAVVVLLLAGLWLASVLRNTGGALTFGAVCLLGVVVFASLVLGLAWWSRSARWLHVRIRSVNGDRVKISFPFSSGVARWGMKMGRRYVDGEALAHMDTAETLIQAWDESPDADEPLFIDIDDEDGDQVQVFIG